MTVDAALDLTQTTALNLISGTVAYSAFALGDLLPSPDQIIPFTGGILVTISVLALNAVKIYYTINPRKPYRNPWFKRKKQ